jgi:hypothetical protein
MHHFERRSEQDNASTLRRDFPLSHRFSADRFLDLTLATPGVLAE